jgi:hypothetical protein
MAIDVIIDAIRATLVILLLVYLGFSWTAILRLRRRVPANGEVDVKWPWLRVPSVVLQGKIAEEYARQFPEGHTLKITRTLSPAIAWGVVLVFCSDLVQRILR